MNIKQLIYGMSTFLPGLSHFHSKGTGGTDSARYCYSVWLRHLVMAERQALLTSPKLVVGELGPGDSIGIGLAALLSGATRYYGMDVVRHASLNTNIRVLDDLVTMFKDRENIPGDEEFPNIKPQLDSYEFPTQILNDEILENSLTQERIDRIRSSLENCDTPVSMIKYVAPWFGDNIIERETIDMIFSQAVLEHIDDLSGAYQAMRSWLKPTGFVSHVIDFKSHGLSSAWNGHWAFSALTWTLMRGRRPFLLNRAPYSTHIGLAQKAGFKIIHDKKVLQPSDIRPEQLATPFINISQEDLGISSTFMQAVIMK